MAEGAKAIYEARIRAVVEEEHFGKVASIDVGSGDCEIAADRDDRWPALERRRVESAGRGRPSLPRSATRIKS